MNRVKITNEYIDNFLLHSNIKRIDNYVNSRSLMACICFWCNDPFKIRWNDLRDGVRCANCAGVKKLTNEIVDRRLLDKNRNIQRLSDYINNSIIMEWKCLICFDIWKASYREVNDYGCANCAGTKKLTNEIVDKRLLDENRNIQRLSEYKNCMTKMDWLCLICNDTWLAKYNSIKNGFGCPNCAGVKKLTNEAIDKILLNENRNIKRLSEYINGKSIMNWLCLICENSWLTSYNTIRQGCGCPKCNIPGMGERLILQILKNNSIDNTHQYSIKNINKMITNDYRSDFYILNLNLIIEYNGIQHYKPFSFYNNSSKEEKKQNLINQQTRDRFVDTTCKENNVNIMWIDGRKYKDKKLKTFILNIINQMKDGTINVKQLCEENSL